MNVLTSAEMRATDQRTAAEFDVPFAELMDHAGAAVARFVMREFPDADRVLVLCGKGNNGGDGLVAARILASEGVGVRVLLLAEPTELQGDAAAALASLVEATSDEIVEAITSPGALRELQDVIGEADLLIDAVVGTGFKPPLHGLAADLRDLVNGLEIPVVAVDLPSGWDADATSQHPDGTTGAGSDKHQPAFRADAVVTFTAPKLAHVFGHLTPGETFGPVLVAPIGSPAEAIQSELGLTWTGASKRLTEKPRNINSNKGMYGHLLIVGGSYGKAGAPSMSSLAALRAGAGLVTAAIPDSIVNTVARITPELMTVPLLNDSEGIATLANLDPPRLEKLMKGITVLAIGPGLSTDGEASEFARRLIETTTVPVVIDADALNAFAGRPELLKGASGKGLGPEKSRTVVLTPHPGEMARLTGMTISEVERDRVALARSFAAEYGVTLVLKGWRTLVAHPDGRVAVNTTGNPAMAKGGSGDILTGIVGAMLAQFPEDVAQAVEAAVYLHGLAADFAAHAMDEHTVLATDTVNHLSNAFQYRVDDEDGFTWITGLWSERPSQALAEIDA